MVSIKPGVRVLGLRPEILLAIVIADGVYTAAGADLVITSAVEGRHSQSSLHYSGCAFDARTREMDSAKVAEIVAALKARLGGDYDVVVEGTHLHVEFQPHDPIGG